jgi:indolepyruvate ferredoxin oxidoreductase
LRHAIELNGVAIEANHRAFLIGRLAAAKPEAVTGLFKLKPVSGETLDQIVTRREAFLTDYQDADYARRFRTIVDRVRVAEAGLGSDKLATAVARSLFKLMAYKDEYEVARLHTKTGLKEKLAAEFEGDWKIVHHLAPPMMNAGTDARGRPLKRAFGPWIRKPFHVLARMKRLRGTPFDPFGYTAERRMERDLIVWYEAKIEEALARLSPQTHDAIAAAMALPMQIRGFGPVKDKAVAEVRPKLDAALASLSGSPHDL